MRTQLSLREPPRAGQLPEGEEGIGLSAESLNFDQFNEYLGTLLWDGDSKNHNKSYRAFLRSASLGIAPLAAVEAVKERITAAGGIIDPVDLIAQMRRAHAFVEGVAVGDEISIPTGAIPPSCPELLSQFAKKAPIADPADFLRTQSPVPPSSVAPAKFLESLYRPGEQIVVFNSFRSQGQAVYRVGARPPMNFPTAGAEGIWFMVQPVDGQFHLNPGSGWRSRRSKESVTRWPYLVLESDKADEKDWIRLLVQLPLPIVAIYKSAGRSIHALVRVDAGDKMEWDSIKARIAKALVPLGADQGALSAVRLSRLPQCHRGGRLQELLYLAPDADGAPICRPLLGSKDLREGIAA